MASRPPFDQFDADSEDIESYLERLQDLEYFTTYDIAVDEDNAAKPRAVLLTSIGSNCFRVLKDLALPDAPNTKTFAQLVTLLREHFKPDVGRSQRDTVSILLFSSKGSPSPISFAN